MGIRTLTEHIKLAQKAPTSQPTSQLARNQLASMQKQTLKPESKLNPKQYATRRLNPDIKRGPNPGVGASSVLPDSSPVAGKGESSNLLGLLGKHVGRPVNEMTGGRLGKAMEALGAGADRPDLQEEAAGAALLAGAGGGAAGLGAMKIRSAQKARAAATAAAAAKARAAAPAAGGAGAELGKLLQKLVTKRASVMSKVAHLDALDEAATERAIEMMKIAQDMEAQGEELTFDDVMELTNPDGSNFLEGLVTDLAMAKLDENGFTE